MGKRCILDNFRVKAYLRCSCTLSTLRASLALFLKFISNSIVFSRSILDNFRVKAYLRCSCTLSTLRASLALFLKFISNSIVFSRSILDNFRVKAYLRCSCTLSTLRASLALFLKFISNSIVFNRSILDKIYIYYSSSYVSTKLRFDGQNPCVNMANKLYLLNADLDPALDAGSRARSVLTRYSRNMKNKIYIYHILDNFRVKACLYKTALVALVFLFLSTNTVEAGCQQRRIKSLCEAPGTPCVWGNNRCSLRRLMPEGEKDENPSVLENFGWKPLNEHKWPKD